MASAFTFIARARLGGMVSSDLFAQGACCVPWKRPVVTVGGEDATSADPAQGKAAKGPTCLLLPERVSLSLLIHNRNVTNSSEDKNLKTSAAALKGVKFRGPVAMPFTAL